MFQKVINSRESMKDEQEARLRPDEKIEADPMQRLRGSKIKLSSRGKKHSKRGKRKSRRS